MTKRVFISYAKEDKGFAEKLFNDLQQAGVKPWLDSVNLIPGQPWEAAIRKAISDSSYFIAALSSRSVGKKGHVQKETRHALDIAEQYPEDKIFIIPVRIDDCEPSFERLRRLHRTDFFPSLREGPKGAIAGFWL
ncbi:MAG TPA: toll/interleukin-1 receptor domain-containing protein [Pyrinomonadaceae bacterium]